jgi:hypothetical protein
MPKEKPTTVITTKTVNTLLDEISVVKIEIKKEIATERDRIEKFRRSELGEPFSSVPNSSSVTW